MEVKYQVFNLFHDRNHAITPNIRLCSVIEVQDGSRIKAPPNLRRPKHFCNIDHNVHGATVVSIDR